MNFKIEVYWEKYYGEGEYKKYALRRDIFYGGNICNNDANKYEISTLYFTYKKLDDSVRLIEKWMDEKNSNNEKKETYWKIHDHKKKLEKEKRERTLYNKLKKKYE